MAAFPPVTSTVDKPSFSKIVAASAAKERASITAIVRSPATTRRPGPKASIAGPIRIEGGEMATSTQFADPQKSEQSAAVAQVVEKFGVDGPCAEQAVSMPEQLAAELRHLELETKPPKLVVNLSETASVERSSKNGNSRTPSDDNSQKADSSSEVGTKPPSLDGKSMTSGTTYALDEKESLRPDDSASVKAAAEDDDAFSIRGSLLAGCRMGSEIAARVHRIQLGDMPPKTITTLVSSHGFTTPLSGISEKQACPDNKAPLPLQANATGTEGPVLYSQNPDDKLLEAMSSPKDRFFLLKLEHQVIEFVQGSEEPFMDLPPSNSFCRMLTHKLADYYHMTHSFEPVPGAVRIYRTPFCRIPPSLSTFWVPPTDNISPVAAVLPRKIMRRGEDAEPTPASAAQSKTTSEVGSDTKDKTLQKEKLTREEREEAYNRARERIFGSTEKAESSTPDGDDSNGLSRASSVSGKEKLTPGTKKKPGKRARDRSDSESFDLRSQYMVVNGVQQTWAPSSTQYYHVGTAAPYAQQCPQPYQNALQPVYGPNNSYPPHVPSSGPYTTLYAGMPNAMPSYPQQPGPGPQAIPQHHPQPQQPSQPQRYQPPAPVMNSASYNNPLPNAPYPAQSAWQPQQAQQNFNQNQYPGGLGNAMSNGTPYLFGQLPVNTNPNDPKSQHPIPGSYNRQAFNPKTQSFVPNAMASLDNNNGRYVAASSLHGSPQCNAVPLDHHGFQPPMPPPMHYGPNAGGYGMARQGSSGSMPGYHHMHHASLGAPLGPPAPQPSMGSQSTAIHMPNHNRPAISQGPGLTLNHLPHYGNPATLPQKPPT